MLADAGYQVVLPDLRGYGDSSKPSYSADNKNYSFRAMGQDLVEVMAHLGHDRFLAAGHDRGARVLHRMCLDHAEAVKKAALLDVAPTLTMYDNTSKAAFAIKYVWWFGYDSMLTRTLVAARTRLVRITTELSNQIRGLMKTFGLIVPRSKGGTFEAHVQRLLEEQDGLEQAPRFSTQ